MLGHRIRDLLKSAEVGTEIEVSGWVRTIRFSSSAFCFIQINDGSSLKGLQIIADETLPNYQSEIKNIGTGASLTVKGEII